MGQQSEWPSLNISIVKKPLHLYTTQIYLILLPLSMYININTAYMCSLCGQCRPVTRPHSRCVHVLSTLLDIYIDIYRWRANGASVWSLVASATPQACTMSPCVFGKRRFGCLPQTYPRNTSTLSAKLLVRGKKFILFHLTRFFFFSFFLLKFLTLTLRGGSKGQMFYGWLK